MTEMYALFIAGDKYPLNIPFLVSYVDYREHGLDHFMLDYLSFDSPGTVESIVVEVVGEEYDNGWSTYEFYREVDNECVWRSHVKLLTLQELQDTVFRGYTKEIVLGMSPILWPILDP